MAEMHFVSTAELLQLQEHVAQLGARWLVGARVACVSYIPVQLAVLATICYWANAKPQRWVHGLSNMSVVTTRYAR